MPINKYLAQYPPSVLKQVNELVQQDKLADFLLKRHPKPHDISNDECLRDYVLVLKNQYMKKSSALSKVIYDSKLQVVHNALGLHSYVSRVQGSKLKSKNEIRVAAVFKKASADFLNMIVVHELAHLKEKEHNKAFYRLCEHMLPAYHQLEFEMRLYLIQLELAGSIYS
jgi:predicted metal-dependent hydrolase